jgi:hypothetical protein
MLGMAKRCDSFIRHSSLCIRFVDSRTRDTFGWE